MTDSTKTAIRSGAAVFAMVSILVLGYIAFHSDPVKPTVIRVDQSVPTTTHAPKPVVRDEEFERRFAEAFERASKPPTVATDTTQPLRRAPVHVVHFAEAAAPATNIRLQFRYPDWPKPDGQPFTFAAHSMRFELLMNGERKFAQERIVSGRLSAQCWAAVIAPGEFMDTPISTRLTILPQGYVTGAASMMPTITSDAVGMVESGVCQ